MKNWFRERLAALLDNFIWLIVLFTAPLLFALIKNFTTISRFVNSKNEWGVVWLILILIFIMIIVVAAIKRKSHLLSRLDKETIQKRPFIIRMTKPQFERVLDGFVNNSDSPKLRMPNVLIGWRILLKRKNVIDEIAEADSIKLIKEPYQGLVLEITEKQAGLWVVVNPEGDKESITVAEKKKRSRFIQFRHMGWKYISVIPKAHNDLLVWLKALEKLGSKEKE